MPHPEVDKLHKAVKAILDPGEREDKKHGKRFREVREKIIGP